MPNNVVEALSRFFEGATFPTLFLGAGVSARAGLPDWRTFVDQLSEGLRSVDPLTAQQMREAAGSGDYSLAVEYFWLSRKILEGDKRKLLSRLLSTFDETKILNVARLPVNACLTSNFDRSVLDAMASARGKSPRDYRLGDASFKQAQWEEGLFVARIHGAVEAPETMVLSTSQFESLLHDETYLDLLRTCFVQRSVLFLGFSFYDPAIKSVFEELNRRFGPASPGRHTALLPKDATSEFLQKANRLNIAVIDYDQKDGHAELWAGIEEFVKPKPKPPVRLARVHAAVSPFEVTKRYLAACYARARAQGGSIALREAVAEGIVSAILQDVAPKPITRAELLERIRITLGLRDRDAAVVVDAAINSLGDAGFCRKIKDDNGRESRLAWTGGAPNGNSLESAITVLVDSFRNRAYLQEGWRPDRRVDETIRRLFGLLIARRGWDLGAAFASGRPPDGVAIAALIVECADGLPAFDRERIGRVCEMMLQGPSEEEATILRQVGRVSFALELAFQSPRSVLLKQAMLPRVLYFDASVLMPAIVEGHPLSSVYSNTMGRLGKAVATGAAQLNTRVASVYLNEIVMHRQLALEYAAEVGKDFADSARMDAMYHGVGNVNVFVGAYASTYEKNPVSFSKFIDRVAPFRTEVELEKWLVGKGIDVVKIEKGTKYSAIYSELEKGYAAGLVRGKRPILIEHDALQLALLDEETRRGESALFVSADRALHRVTSDTVFSYLTGMMLSNVALVQLVDLLLGGVADELGMAELLWSGRISDRANAIRAYFTTRGLEQYDEAMAMEMPKIIEKFAGLSDKELDRSGVDLDAEEPRARAAAVRRLGMLEKDYLQGMREAAEKLRGRLEESNPGR